MLLFVGLGNPGPQYAHNRHNIGFMAVDEIHRQTRGTLFRSKFQGDLAEVTVAGEKVLLLKPQTFMNESGRSVQPAMAFYKLKPTDVVVFHDELDLAAGKLRMKTGGGHAGHNGLRSIAAHVGPNFRRVRLGIGHPGDKDKVVGHVLKDFAKADQGWLDKMLDGIARHVDLIAAGDDQQFQTKVAQHMSPPRSSNSNQMTEKGPDDGV